MSELIPVFLVGFSGTGKTSIINFLEKESSYKVADVDSQIENIFSKSINDIFSENGEDEFRRCEKETILKDISDNYQIIAPGGGAALSFDNAKTMMNVGKVIYLKSDPEKIYSRIRNDLSRPLLKEKSFNEIETMINARNPLYKQCADYEICIDDLTIKEVSNKVVEYYESLNRTR